MKMQKLAIFLADNDIKQKQLAQILNVLPAQITRWVQHGGYYVASDYYGNYQLMQSKKTFSI